MLALLNILSILLFPSGKIDSAVKDYVKNLYTGYASIEVEVVTDVSPYDTFEIIKGNGIEGRGGNYYLPVTFIKDGRKTVKTIALKVKLYKQVLVCRSKLPRNTQLSYADFSKEIMDVAPFNRETAAVDIELKNFKNRTGLKPGEILFEQDLEKMPVVTQGSLVKAEYNAAGVVVSFDASARQDGAAGETISVITKDKKIFKAIVKDSLTVEVLE